jgi:hypothetical protein
MPCRSSSRSNSSRCSNILEVAVYTGSSRVCCAATIMVHTVLCVCVYITVAMCVLISSRCAAPQHMYIGECTVVCVKYGLMMMMILAVSESSLLAVFRSLHAAELRMRAWL